jgi:PAS domain S-box-containing protein
MNRQRLKILLIEDNPDDAELLQEILSESAVGQWEVVNVERLSAALQCLSESAFDVVLSDISLPDAKGLETVIRIHEAAPEVPLLVLTGLDDEALGLEALRRGAQDYLVKDQINQSLLVRAIRYAIERTQTQKQLSESEQRFRAIFNQTFQFMALLSPEGKILEANQTILDWLEKSKAEVTNCPLEETQWWSRSPQVQARLKNAIAAAAAGRFVRMEVEQVETNDIVSAVDFSIKPVINEGRVLLLIAEGRDISDRLSIEKSLRRQVAAVEAATDGIAIFNQDSEYIYLNDAYLQLYGYSDATTLIGKTWRELSSLEENQQFEQNTFPLLWENGQWRGEAIGKKRDGTTFPAEIGLTLIDQDGFICVCRDITQRKQAETEVLKALAQEKELNQLKSDFVSMLSHDFRNPLATIRSSAELLEHYGHKSTAEKKHLYFDRIKTSIKNMTALLDEVLLISSAEAGKLRCQPAPLDLEKFCYELLEELQVSAGEHYQLMFVPPPNNVDKPALPCFDESLLRHIFGNLLSNAIKYSPQGGRICWQLTYEKGGAIFQVQDAGIGIPPSEKSRLFESFHRASNVGKIPGTGLGLAIVKKCVDVHGGLIEFESTPGVGTTFTVVLPLG